MNELATYAAIAEIFGAVTIVLAGIFGAVQFFEFRKSRRDEVAAELCRRFAEAELARAITLIKTLPENSSIEQMRAMGPEYEPSALIVGMTFETMGLLVYRNIASFSIVQDLCGGLLLEMWYNIKPWCLENREKHNNPCFGEWLQWLAERLEETEADVTPAYDAHKSWKP
jgi:hypothetical protein